MLNNALALVINEKLERDLLVLPTLPNVALKIREATENPNTNVTAMAELITLDPALSARIIKISNSAFMGRQVKVQTVAQAVTRIGLSQIKNITTALAIEQLFEAQHPLITKLMDRALKDIVNVTTTALAALTLYQTNSQDKRLNIDTMTLAAMVHNIGYLPILAEAERNPEVFANQKFIDTLSPAVVSAVSTKIIAQWEFDAMFAQISRHAFDSQVTNTHVDYIDFIRLAYLLNGKLDNDIAESVRNNLQLKKITEDFSEFDTPEFNDLVAKGKSIFSE